jgi:glycerol-3-phosphate dehydrogenase (NAD(P)+)
MKIIVFGAGSWGTALALSACSNPLAKHQVTLWTRDAGQAYTMQSQRENKRYLPGIELPATLNITSSDWVESGVATNRLNQVGQGPLGRLASAADLVVISTPVAGLRELLTQLASCQVPVVWLCKGFEAALSSASCGFLAHEVQAQVAPDVRACVLSGPSFAIEVARAQPSALVAASTHAAVQQALVEAFHSPKLRVYATDDIVGVEVGGAVKNVLAIATGLCDGLHLGFNARAALITRGLTEMTRLGVALGARAETFMGLSGVGDLVLTATGDLSRNRQIGLAMARGQTLEQAITEVGHVAEGVYCAHTVLQRAARLGVEMPITQTVVAMLAGRLQPEQAVGQLMSREPRAEVA